MVNAEDRDWFRRSWTRAREKLSVSWDEVVNARRPTREGERAPLGVDEGTHGRLIYGDYLVPGADRRCTSACATSNELRKVVEEALEDYNSVTSAPMNLVMFLDAIEHVSRVCRVISLPLGNALLLGVGGSGRQSLTRLAAALEEFDLFQIEVAKGYGKNEWRDDLRKVLTDGRVRGQGRGVPLRGHADRAGELPGGHQQHPQLGGGAEPVEVRGHGGDRRGAATDHAEPGLAHHEERGERVLHHARPLEAALRAGDVPGVGLRSASACACSRRS